MHIKWVGLKDFMHRLPKKSISQIKFKYVLYSNTFRSSNFLVRTAKRTASIQPCISAGESHCESKKNKRFNTMMKISNHKVFLNIRNVIINAAIFQSLKAGRIRKQVSIIHESIQNLINNRSFRDADQ